MVYNGRTGKSDRSGCETIKNGDILSIISDISETLSLNSKPRHILGTTLDTLSGIFKADCSWAQLADAGGDGLSLVASLGFTADMKRELDRIDRSHRFSREIVGLGHKIVIPSLSRDGKYNIPIFEESGFGSLLAVPIITYRISGVLGMAFRTRTKFGKDQIQLFEVIAGLIGMSLQKSAFNEQPVQRRQAEPASPDEMKPGDDKTDKQAIQTSSDQDTPTISVTTAGNTNQDSKFRDHDRSMRLFSKSHKQLQITGTPPERPETIP